MDGGGLAAARGMDGVAAGRKVVPFGEAAGVGFVFRGPVGAGEADGAVGGLLVADAQVRFLVLAGGMHATVAPDEMEAIPEFDKICQGPGEGLIVDLVTNPGKHPRMVLGLGAKSMAPGCVNRILDRRDTSGCKYE